MNKDDHIGLYGGRLVTTEECGNRRSLLQTSHERTVINYRQSLRL